MSTNTIEHFSRFILLDDKVFLKGLGLTITNQECNLLKKYDMYDICYLYTLTRIFSKIGIKNLKAKNGLNKKSIM